MSSIVNKIKEAVHPDKSHTGTAEGTHGPHASRMANAADPRVDSDRDGSHTVGSDGHHHYTTSDNYTHSSGTAGGPFASTKMTGPAATTAGPHSSDMANKLDPRVDSDMDGSGGTSKGHFTHGTGAFAGTHGNTMGTATTNTKTGVFGSGPGPAPNTAGPHRHDAVNKMDPFVDSVSGPGPASHTAGPHTSDVMNKVDPRVDSDMDGSRTYGSTTNTGPTRMHKDPFDAAHVPPSVLRKHVGDPVIEHDDHNFERERRNSTISHQDAFRGV